MKTHGNRGSDVLLISQLNARWPERYRANTEGRDQSAKEALNEIREMHKSWKAKLELETGMVEGELSEECGLHSQNNPQKHPN